MANIISGKELAEEIKAELKLKIDELKRKGKTPGLATILVGKSPASIIYVRNKGLACESLGIYSEQYNLDENITQEDLVSLIHKLNQEDKIDGILVQLPLPKHLDEMNILASISPDKDVDGFHFYSVGRFFCEKDYNNMKKNKLFLPATPYGIMEMLIRKNIKLEGANAVVLGRSNIVGKPIAMLLLSANATVTICHSKTQDLANICKNGDILIAAIGKPKFVKQDMVKEGVVVIDVGINRVDDKIVGDVDFDEVSKKASLITPVPGGVGPMTITMLMVNTVVSAERHLNEG
ncbi:TPA: bifunctional methylenetetrahydrofolate dehydrogenase/methenyltetrahydrofolate cyclohydrolase FolD [bacterium]|nr:bifunctional methylenetetrahydrofolate dehydrogenase/methenyltetrahydrofolate cyclohydrolase FolD [bacterium]